MASIDAVLTAENGDDLYPYTYDDYVLDSNNNPLSTRLANNVTFRDPSSITPDTNPVIRKNDLAQSLSTSQAVPPSSNAVKTVTDALSSDKLNNYTPTVLNGFGSISNGVYVRVNNVNQAIPIGVSAIAGGTGYGTAFTFGFSNLAFVMVGRNGGTARGMWMIDQESVVHPVFTATGVTISCTNKVVSINCNIGYGVPVCGFAW